jgi:hypothetical protein
LARHSGKATHELTFDGPSAVKEGALALPTEVGFAIAIEIKGEI